MKFPTSETRTRKDVLDSVRGHAGALKLQIIPQFRREANKGGVNAESLRIFKANLSKVRETIEVSLAAAAADPGFGEYARDQFAAKSGISLETTELFAAIDQTLQWIDGNLPTDAKGYLDSHNKGDSISGLLAQLDGLTDALA